MHWFRLSVSFAADPKVLAAGDTAAFVYIKGLAYCASQLTDGLISDRSVAGLCTRATLKSATKKLVDAGLWERVDGGFRVLNYDKWQESAETVKARRAWETERKRARRAQACPGGTTPGTGAKKKASKAAVSRRDNHRDTGACPGGNPCVDQIRSDPDLPPTPPTGTTGTTGTTTKPSPSVEPESGVHRATLNGSTGPRIRDVGTRRLEETYLVAAYEQSVASVIGVAHSMSKKLDERKAFDDAIDKHCPGHDLAFREGWLREVVGLFAAQVDDEAMKYRGGYAASGFTRWLNEGGVARSALGPENDDDDDDDDRPLASLEEMRRYAEHADAIFKGTKP